LGDTLTSALELTCSGEQLLALYDIAECKSAPSIVGAPISYQIKPFSRKTLILQASGPFLRGPGRFCGGPGDFRTGRAASTLGRGLSARAGRLLHWAGPFPRGPGGFCTGPGHVRKLQDRFYSTLPRAAAHLTSLIASVT
jgi:hypothetical protein